MQKYTYNTYMIMPKKVAEDTRSENRPQFDKSQIECYKCHQLRNFQYECSNDARAVNYAEFEDNEEIMLMATVDVEGYEKETERLMAAVSEDKHDKDSFYQIGKCHRLEVKGKGDVCLTVNGIAQVITNVYYVPLLTSNLISVGQLQEKSLTFVIQGGVCMGFHPQKVSDDSKTQLWHKRFGHVNHKAIRTILYKRMVKGLPSVAEKHTSEGIRLEMGERPRGQKVLPTPIKGGPHSQNMASRSGVLKHGNTISKGVFGSNSTNLGFKVRNSSFRSLDEKVPEEFWTGSKPSVEHFKVFGCIGHVHIPAAYRLHDPSSKIIVISRDVILNEDATWDWSEENQKAEELSIEDDEKVQGSQHENEDVKDSQNTPDTTQNSKNEAGSPDQDEDPFNEDEAGFAMYSAMEDPETYVEACEDEKWVQAMNAEMTAIERNHTWELVDPPAGTKPIGVKWLYKTKLN
ncbi:retrovirus-related pol polyprotein from transposon TNT 1-94, partial [Tanacetum coccineum]